MKENDAKSKEVINLALLELNEMFELAGHNMVDLCIPALVNDRNLYFGFGPIPKPKL